MPLYTYQCKTCDNVFDTLVLGSEKASCPSCGGEILDWLPGMTAPPPVSKSIIKTARARAFREGHFSNYDRGQQDRLLQGKPEK